MREAGQTVKSGTGLPSRPVIRPSMGTSSRRSRSVSLVIGAFGIDLDPIGPETRGDGSDRRVIRAIRSR